MKNEESLQILQSFVGSLAIVFGLMMVVGSYVIKEPDRKVIHPMLGEISLRYLFIVIGSIMTFFGGLTVM